MALLVEDGTGVAGAESYVTVAEFRTWATNRSYVLPIPDADVESLLRKAADFIERKRFVGTPEFDVQTMSFPRSVLGWDGLYVSTGIPAKLKTAQMLLAMESMNGPLTAVARANKYAATKIDQIYLKYADSSKGSGDLYFPAIDDLLRDWLATGGFAITTVRA